MDWKIVVSHEGKLYIIEPKECSDNAIEAIEDQLEDTFIASNDPA